MKLKLQEGELFAYNAGRKAERSMLKKIIDVEILALRKEMDTSVGGDASWQTFARIDALEDLKKRLEVKTGNERMTWQCKKHKEKTDWDSDCQFCYIAQKTMAYVTKDDLEMIEWVKE